MVSAGGPGGGNISGKGKGKGKGSGFTVDEAVDWSAPTDSGSAFSGDDISLSTAGAIRP